MSEEHTRQLMRKYFPKCPLCKSEADYAVSPSFHVVQCNECNAKFMSEDLKDPNSDLTILSLFALPPDITDEKLLATFTSLRYKKHPISFWQEFELEINLISHINREQMQEGEEILLRLEKGWYAIRHGEKYEWSKAFFRFELRRKLILTNKRILFLKEEKLASEIPLDQIIEAYPDVQGIGNHYIRLKLKDGGGASIFFVVLSPKMLLGAPYMIGKQKALTDRWINAIINQIRIAVLK